MMVAFTIIVVAGIIGAGIAAVNGGFDISNVSNMAISLIMGDDRADDSAARKAGKVLEDASKTGDFVAAGQALPELMESLSKTLQKNPAKDEYATLLKSAASWYGESLVKGGKKYLPEERVAEAPTMANVPVQLVPPEVYNYLEGQVRANGGTFAPRPAPETVMEPGPAIPVEQLPSRVVETRVSDSIEPLLTGPARWRRVEELNRRKKAGQLSQSERNELARYDQEWRNRKAATVAARAR